MGVEGWVHRSVGWVLGGCYDADGGTNGNGAPRDGGMDEQTRLRCAGWVVL